MALTKAKFGVISSALASGNATDGYVLTADGSGNSAWEEAAGGVAGISSSADATAITIDSSENVAIGSSTANKKFNIADSAQGGDALKLEFEAFSSSDKWAIYAYDRTNSHYANMSLGQNAIWINGADANIGIGSTSPSVALEVHKNSSGSPVFELKNTNAAGYSGIHIRNNSDTLIGHVGYGNASVSGALADEVFFGSISSTPVVFTSADTERMRILSTGNLLIGKTAINQTTTTGHEFSTGSTVYRTDFSTANNEFMIFNNHSSPAGTASISFRYDNSQKGSIGLTSTGVSYNTTSDYRLKENVVTDWDATTRLKQLRPSRFNFIADADTTVDGFLAHEVSDIVPEAITGEKDATKTLSNVVLNSDNKIIGEDVSEDDWTAGKTGDDAIYPSDSTWEASHTVPVYQGIDQAKLVPLLVKTIQELEARITTLENA